MLCETNFCCLKIEHFATVIITFFLSFKSDETVGTVVKRHTLCFEGITEAGVRVTVCVE